MTIRRAVGALGLLLACAVALASGQRVQINREGLRTKIQKIIADGATPSMAVAVARNGEIVWSEGGDDLGGARTRTVAVVQR